MIQDFNDNIYTSENIDEIKNQFEKTIELSPSINNPAWYSYGKFLLQHSIENFDDVMNKCFKQNPFHITSVKLYAKKIKKQNKDGCLDGSLEYINKAISESYGRNKFEVEIFKLYWVIDNSLDDKIEDYVEDLKKRYKNKLSIVKYEARYYAKYFGNIDKAISILESFLKNEYSRELYHNLFEYYLLKNDFDSAEKLIGEYFNNDNQMIIDLYSKKNEWSKVVELYENIEHKTLDDYHGYTFALMKNKDFQCAEKVIKSILEKLGWTNEKSSIFVVNYELCRLKNGKNVKEERLNRISNISGNLVKVGIFLLKSDEAKAIDLIKKEIKNNYIARKTLLNWVFFDDDKYQKIKDILSN